MQVRGLISCRGGGLFPNGLVGISLYPKGEVKTYFLRKEAKVHWLLQKNKNMKW
jgi:hypothetical protein